MAPTPPRERRQATRPARPYNHRVSVIDPRLYVLQRFFRWTGKPSSQTLQAQREASVCATASGQRTRKAATAAPAPIAKTEAISFIVGRERSTEALRRGKRVDCSRSGLARKRIDWGAFFPGLLVGSGDVGDSATRRNRLRYARQPRTPMNQGTTTQNKTK